MNEDKFANRAAGWDNPEKIKMTDKFITEMLLHVTPHADARALEIGAGIGLAGLQIAPMVKEIVFEDTSEAMLSVLKQKMPRNIQAEILHGEIFDYHHSDIDLVFSFMAFHHIPDIDKTLHHLANITNPNAIVVVGDLVSEDGSFHNFEPIPQRGFDISDLSERFRNAGFLILTAHPYNTLMRTDENGQTKEYDQFILVAKK